MDERVPVPAPSVATLLLDDEAVLLDESSGTLHFLGGGAGAVWSGIDGRRSVGLIASQLSERFADDRRAVRADVRRTVGRLCRLGLLHQRGRHDRAAPASPAASAPPASPLRDPADRPGAAYFRTLSFAFRVICAPPGLRGRLRDALARFETAPGPVHAEFVVEAAAPGPDTTFLLRRDDDLLLAGATADAVLDHVLWHVGSGTATTTGELVLVHAGAVASARRAGLLLPGPSGSGKSTLVAALVRAGFGYLSDEVGVLDPATLELQPFPKSLTLEAGSRHLFPELAARGGAASTWHVDPDEVRHGSVAGPCAVSWVIAPTWRPSGPTSLVEMSAAEICYTLGANTMALRSRGRDAFLPLGRIAAGARGARMSFSDQDDAVAQVSALMDDVP